MDCAADSAGFTITHASCIIACNEIFVLKNTFRYILAGLEYYLVVISPRNTSRSSCSIFYCHRSLCKGGWLEVMHRSSDRMPHSHRHRFGSEQWMELWKLAAKRLLLSGLWQCSYAFLVGFVLNSLNHPLTYTPNDTPIATNALPAPPPSLLRPPRLGCCLRAHWLPAGETPTQWRAPVGRHRENGGVFPGGARLPLP